MDRRELSWLTGALLVWRRNLAVWGRSWRTSMVGSIGEPVLYFLGLGYGLGTLVKEVGGVPYLNYVAPGLMLSSTMYSATIESTYSTFTKMAHQRVFASMLLSPLTFGDIVFGEIMWAATKGAISGVTVLLLSVVFGVAPVWAILPGTILIGFCGLLFAGLGLLVTSISRSYDHFNYYFTLGISPMFFFSGIFFPVETLGQWVGYVAWCFPLTHLVNLSRSLMAAAPSPGLAGDVVWLSLFGPLVLFAAVNRMSKRFLD